MKEFLQLPYDSSGYGDFGVSYVGTDARVHFRYRAGGKDRIPELYFEFCIHMSVNGILNSQKQLPYDVVLAENYKNEEYEGFSRFLFMLSGSDFQFEIIAKNCTFAESTEKSTLVE
ncbi:hypothetical protein [Mesorhizobium sp. L-2-11]|uniref:hypothetical protein n=1 Tax=Mesorhizobium sp. L-2-11 TaxID=2744521 RepID=UPI001926245F|nr:hypothetical protein [Mesorhizobium sp. L-2-11]BCH16793.1 hypothetical protein MesoLjLa_36440 [Mesorhizobium sp. L-2-11]BCH17226.1 hypothetical protein MesoLjLa_40770 [Mesorhizobium sp. L-2-11]BCH19476.1 hypothetical protein MesoLjLa_63270 [Mesorhizobium sp. L-2-11]BCH19891.1 hypothetical protein MesoLjLa_67420 [Mesorhizobium sp. L-2-11]